MKTNLDFFVNRNWFSDREVLKILYCKNIKNLNLIDKNDHGNNSLFLRIIKHGKTLNLLPTYGYNSLFSNYFNYEKIEEIKKELSQIDCTTCYLPLQFSEEYNNVLTKKVAQLYSSRLPSYNISLSNSIDVIKSNVSKRRRSKLKPPFPNSQVMINTNELYKKFPSLYLDSMKRLGANKRFLFKKNVLNQLSNLKNCILIGVTHEEKLMLIHLIGFDNEMINSDFIFSASTSNGNIFSSYLIWETIKYLKSKGFKNYNLGGGIRINDGLDNFKSQFGGEKIYNGGLKLVCDKILYENELFKKKNKTEMNNFFPEYLAGKA